MLRMGIGCGFCVHRNTVVSFRVCGSRAGAATRSTGRRLPVVTAKLPAVYAGLGPHCMCRFGRYSDWGKRVEVAMWQLQVLAGQDVR